LPRLLSNHYPPDHSLSLLHEIVTSLPPFSFSSVLLISWYIIVSCVFLHSKHHENREFVLCYIFWSLNNVLQ
jgi:hypothetical protein